MSNNLRITAMPSAIGGRAALFNTIAGELDGRVSEVAEILVGSSNEASITAHQLRRHAAFIIAPDSPAPSDDISITIPAGPWGIIDFFNATAQDVIIVTEDI